MTYRELSALESRNPRLEGIAARWAQSCVDGGRLLADAVLTIPADVPARRALMAANVESSGSMTAEQDRELRATVAELLAVPPASAIMIAGFAPQRRVLAEAFAHRAGRQQAALEDYLAADAQLPIIDQWVIGLRQARCRRRCVDIMRDILHAGESRNLRGTAWHRTQPGIVRARAVGHVGRVYAEDVDSTISRDIGARIRAQREQTGRSQEDVAHGLELKQREISRWETGAVRPSGRNLKRLADELGCHWTVLAYGADMSGQPC